MGDEVRCECKDHNPTKCPLLPLPAAAKAGSLDGEITLSLSIYKVYVGAWTSGGSDMVEVMI